MSSTFDLTVKKIRKRYNSSYLKVSPFFFYFVPDYLVSVPVYSSVRSLLCHSRRVGRKNNKKNVKHQ